MHMLRASKAWLWVIVLSVFAGGCGREQTGFVVPTVISTNPANLAMGVPVTQIITVTFSEPMDPATINTATFTVASPGGLVSGAVVSLRRNCHVYSSSQSAP